MNDQPKPHARVSPLRDALTIAGAYALVAAAWLLLSDRVLALVTSDVVLGHWLQTAKGLAFVAVTGALLYALCYRRFRRLQETQSRLRESRRQHLMLLGNLPGMAYRCQADEHWTMLFVSRGCEALTGYKPDQLLDNAGVSYEELIHADDRAEVRRSVEESIKKGIRFRLEYRIHKACGEERWVWEQGGPVFGADGRLIALEGFITDITERKRAEQIEQERANLREASRAAEQVLGVIGHELRTPLASLRLLAETLLDGDARDVQQRDRFLRGILDQTVQLTNMANDMLESARLRHGGSSWKWTTVNLERVCAEAIELMRPIADGQRATLAAEVKPTEVTMQGDTDGIRRLIVNLLSNACRHTPEGHVQVTARTLDRDEGGRWVQIQVRDDGSGMAPEVAANLGSAFALTRGAVSCDPTAGVGLGLAICRQIVAAHGGFISVKTDKGKGTTFTVALRADLSRAASVEVNQTDIHLAAA